LGHNALANQNFTGGEVSYNTAVGYTALNANTTGEQNTAVGYGALDANTTAGYNTAIGANSLGVNSTGQYNTALGRNALLGNTTADFNTSVGFRSMETNSTGTNNTAVGSYALLANTTANNNVAIGFQTLYPNTTGANNTAVGQGAGGSITTGSSNTFIGNSAGTNTTTGIGNTFIGYNLVHTNSEASYNLLAGYNSTTASAGNGWATFGYNNARTYIFLGGTSWSGTSDLRLKENVVDHTLGLGFINALRPVTYNWKKKKDVPSELSDYYREGSDDRVNGTGALRHGFIAQEVKAVMDSNNLASDSFNLWNIMGDGTQALADGELVPILVKAIQELSAQNAELTTRIEALEG
jgi:hypothetical protein